MAASHATRYALAGMLVLVAAVGPADAGFKEWSKGWTGNLTIENDLFGSGLDRHYTNGLMLTALSPEGDTPELLAPLTTFGLGITDDSRSRWSFGIGQKIFTPEDITIKERQDFTRPYAGWLYGSLGVVNKNVDHLNSFEATVGVVGPASMAEDIQTMWHEFIGSPRPQGWHNQLDNELGLVLSYEYKRRNIELAEDLFGSGIDIDTTPHVGASIGNVYTFAATGMTFRLGRDLPDDYGAPRIRPTLGGAGFFEPVGDPGPDPDPEKSNFWCVFCNWYLFAGIEGRAVARNIFLDGNTFGGSPRVDKKPLVGDVQAGLVFTITNNTRMSFNWIYRTREFERQSDPDVFGAFNFSVAF